MNINVDYFAAKKSKWHKSVSAMLNQILHSNRRKDE